MEYLFDYLQFTARLVTVVVVVALPLFAVAFAVHARRQHGEDVRLSVRRLNERARNLRLALESGVLPPRAFKDRLKQAKHEHKERLKADVEHERRLYVCRFSGDLRASAVAALREEISAILAVARARDEVAVVLESAGGAIPGYGLAASQLRRVRARGIRLTVVVDKIAASGGYMMACVADEIVAAPFAIVGSIGVVAQLPNFNRLLKKHAVDFEQITAGRYKRTVSLFGENTPAGREKLQEEINDAHELFKEFVGTHRPALELEAVATGEYWFATRALELGLVDRIATSDEYIGERFSEWQVFEVRAEIPRRFKQWLRERAGALLERG